MNEEHGIIIREAYKDYEPPFDVVRIVNRLLAGVPNTRLAGLKTVVLSSSANLSKPVRKAKAHARGKSYELGKCRGRYHQKWKNESAWIELWVDNMLMSCPKPLLWVNILRDFAIADTLFHELGHHIHYSQAPEHKEKEDVADKWDKRLSRQYFRRRYWYWMPLFLLLWLILKPFGLFKKRRKN